MVPSLIVIGLMLHWWWGYSFWTNGRVVLIDLRADYEHRNLFAPLRCIECGDECVVDRSVDPADIVPLCERHLDHGW